MTTLCFSEELEEAENDATPDSLPFCWQQNLLWLNCDSLRHEAESQGCFGISRGAFVLYHLYGWDTGDSTVLNAVQTYSSRDFLLCSVESNLFPDFLKSAYITITLSLTKFSPIGVAVCHYRKRWFLLQGIHAQRCFAITSLTLLSFCLSLMLKYFPIKVENHTETQSQMTF